MKVLTVLKHIFIPHNKNDYKPHFFRQLGVSIILFGSVFLLGSSFGTTFFMRKTVLGVQISSGVLIDLTNESRLADNQPALIRNQVLDKAAELKGEDMASKQYFSHDSPEGVTPWHWFRKVGYNFLYAGENLAINFTEAGDVERAWMQSPLHKANIMNVQFREIGLAVVEGVYEGYPTMYVVQLFGTPAYGKTVSALDNEHGLVQVVTSPSSQKSKAGAGDVKGEQATGVLSKASSTTPTEKNKMTTSLVVATNTSPIQNVIATPEMVVVQDTSVFGVNTVPKGNVVTYSTWYQKIMWKSAYYIDIIYKILICITGLALLAMILIEIKKQHYIHILYGFSLLMILCIFTYINQIFL